MSKHGMSRRALCAGTGAWIAASAAALRVAAGAPFPPDSEAYSPWHLWNDKSIAGTPLALVAAGILAANPHDTQPWLFRVTGERIEIFADLSRNLGAMDALLREMHLGLGCAIENMLLAAPPNGYDASLDVVGGSLLSLGEERATIPAATLRLSKLAPQEPDALYGAIPERHTNRYAYDRNRALAFEWLEFVRQAAAGDDVRLFLFTDGPARDRFDATVIDATAAIIADPEMAYDNMRWMRRSHDAIEAHRDGLTYASAGLSPLMQFLAGLVPLPRSMENHAWLAQTRDTHLASAPVTGLIAVRDRYDRAQSIAAGQTWQRLHLSAAVHGISMQPLNQPIEMVDREMQAGSETRWAARVDRLANPGWQTTFAFRAGYCNEAASPSPRRALRDVVRLG